MSEHSDLPTAQPEEHPSPEDVARLLEVVSDHSVDHALSDMEAMLARLRANAEQAIVARRQLRETPPQVLREAMRLRAAQIDSSR